MANPYDEPKKRGFWDGGQPGHGHNKEASGRPSGLPGKRRKGRIGVNTDLEFPPESLAIPKDR